MGVERVVKGVGVGEEGAVVVVIDEFFFLSFPGGGLYFPCSEFNDHGRGNENLNYNRWRGPLSWTHTQP